MVQNSKYRTYKLTCKQHTNTAINISLRLFDNSLEIVTMIFILNTLLNGDENKDILLSHHKEKTTPKEVGIHINKYIIQKQVSQIPKSFLYLKAVTVGSGTYSI